MYIENKLFKFKVSKKKEKITLYHRIFTYIRISTDLNSKHINIRHIMNPGQKVLN